MDTAPDLPIVIYALDDISEKQVRLAVAAMPDAIRRLTTRETVETCYRAGSMALLVLPMDCLSLLQELTRQAVPVPVPIVVLLDDDSQLEAALASGAVDAFPVALPPALLTRRLSALATAYRTRQMQSNNTSGGRFEVLYLHAPIVMHVIGRDGRFLRVNQRWLDVLGYRADQVEGHLYVDFLRPEIRAEGLAGLDALFESGTIRDLVIQLRTYDDMYREFLLDANTFTEADGTITAVSALRDVTDLTRSQAHHQQADLLYHSLFESSADVILLVDQATERILDSNDTAADLLGYSKEALKTLLMSNIEAAPVVRVADKNCIHYDAYYQRHDGTQMAVESHAHVIPYGDRMAVLHVAHDITNRKKLLEKETATRLLSETLRESAVELAKSVSVSEVLDTAMRMALRVIPGPTANVSQLQSDHIRLLCWTGYEAFGFDDVAMGAFRIPVSATDPIHRMQVERKPMYVPDTHAIGWMQRTGATSTWVRSYIGAPIVIGDTLYGSLNIDSPIPNAFTETHLEALQALANQVATALDNARLVEELQSAKASLEAIVTERTEALVQANRSLRRYNKDLRTTQETLEQERGLLQLIIDSIADMIYVKDQAGRYLLLNQASVAAMGGQTQADLIGKSADDMYDDEYATRHRQIDDTIMASGEPLLNFDNRMTYADGSVHRQLLSKMPLYDKQQQIIGIVGINRDITQLTLIEQNLRQEREQMAQVLHSARCLLWTATLTQQDDTLDWQLRVVNEEAAHSLLPLETGDRTYSQVWPSSIVAEDAERRLYVMKTHLKFNRYHFNHEMRCISADGSVLWLAEDVEITKRDDQHWYLVGICTDITERRQAEANLQAAYDDLEQRIQDRMEELLQVNTALRSEIGERQRAEEAERRQRLLAEALTQSLATLNSSFDRDALFDYLLDSIEDIVPHRAANIMLVDADTLIGSVVRLRGYPNAASVQQERHLIRNYPDKMHILTHNTHYIIHDTHLFEGWSKRAEHAWIRSALSVPITLDEGVIGFLNVESEVANTFTIQHAEWLMAFANQAALALRNARLLDQVRSYAADLEKTVQARTAQLRAVLGSIRDGLIYHNLNDETQYLNKALVDMLGYSADDWMRSRLHYETLIVDEAVAGEPLRARWAKTLAKQGYMQEEVVLRRHDQTTFPAMIMRVLVRDDDDQPIGTLTLTRDISQEKNLQEQRERFIANASHELRTPIANIKTRLYLMSRKPESVADNLAIIVKVTNWMQRLVDDMFDLARFQRGLLELRRETVDLRELMREILVFQQPEAERKDILLMYNAPIDAIMTYVDPYRLMQVFSNLVGNAIHYTPLNGEVGVEIGIRNEDGQPELVIIVADSGSGIAPQYLDNLFKPFFRASIESSGAGLGLAIVHEIIELHGGRITVDSLVDVGSRFTIYLPYTTDNAGTE